MDMQNIETQLEELKAQVEAVSKKTAENKLAMVVFSGDLDKVLGRLRYRYRSCRNGNGSRNVFYILGYLGPQRQEKKGWRQRHDGQDVRCHAAEGHR